MTPREALIQRTEEGSLKRIIRGDGHDATFVFVYGLRSQEKGDQAREVSDGNVSRRAVVKARSIDRAPLSGASRFAIMAPRIPVDRDATNLSSAATVSALQSERRECASRHHSVDSVALCSQAQARRDNEPELSLSGRTP